MTYSLKFEKRALKEWKKLGYPEVNDNEIILLVIAIGKRAGDLVYKLSLKTVAQCERGYKDRISRRLVDDLKSYRSIIKWLFSQLDLKKGTYC
ncbi:MULTISPECIES: hypothetical protein [Photorhabdus]|uniref:hypothetical protein n=1 Tax=Photorhabdus TaxID=29487 RepID=UPI000DCC088C|nr:MULTISPECIES: hypothetical protein [Photorhabdus]MCT8342197.1 hypothetical protein [Photorhabdus kleinii]RAW95264.1 hypothetical protein CKY03_18170 [Photorhabdus sp. S9-53]RAW95431.1 hypothetical protein CKY05_17960 [Photorhabdus sp. S10-54]RAW98162.1 hypothetical protein CKY04_20155 [Photorhabdus sp. S8-52]